MAEVKRVGLRWYNTGRYDAVCEAWQRWFSSQPVWTFTLHADGRITGDWSSDIEAWRAQEPR